MRMGSHLVRSYITESDVTPDPRKPSEYDPTLGFGERKERGDTTAQTHFIRAFHTLSLNDRVYMNRESLGPQNDSELQVRYATKCVRLVMSVCRVGVITTQLHVELTKEHCFQKKHNAFTVLC